MKALPLKANICEIEDGRYYPVRMGWVPRVGELIDLFSYLEQAASQPSRRHYEVVQVVHELRDVAEAVKESHPGHHVVNVYVRAVESPFFGSA
jgi:hypothetical protein